MQALQKILEFLCPNRFKVLPRKCKKRIAHSCVIDLTADSTKCLFCKKEAPKESSTPLSLIRQTMELSQKEMALKLGIHFKTYQTYERLTPFTLNGRTLLKTKLKIIEIFDEWIKTATYQDDYFKEKFRQLKHDLLCH